MPNFWLNNHPENLQEEKYEVKVKGILSK